MSIVSVVGEQRPSSSASADPISHHRLGDERQRAAAARANALRFAKLALDEDDEAMKAYLRHVAVSWTHAAERFEFLLEMDAPPAAY